MLKTAETYSFIIWTEVGGGDHHQVMFLVPNTLLTQKRLDHLQEANGKMVNGDPMTPSLDWVMRAAAPTDVTSEDYGPPEETGYEDDFSLFAPYEIQQSPFRKGEIVTAVYSVGFWL